MSPVEDDDTDPDRSDQIPVSVRHGDGEATLLVNRGAMLRDALFAADAETGADTDLSPYARATERVNCGGRGLCATCGVRVIDGPEASHWHDRLADRFGYPRLSCRIRVTEPMTVALVTDKRVWGGRERDE
ncbi:2Fe-2S iron-sulfur cluster-binding protein [Halobaculum gomorrense]|uniref:2Fe-2S iron-sulfur cluster-binding protein n=1 Tax=Halobaculum gomorrense TaxID=43928 RepID=UPI000934280C